MAYSVFVCYTYLIKHLRGNIMYNKIKEWLDSLPLHTLPDNVAAFNFNIYEDGDDWWSVEIVATDRFDVLDQDWACDEIADFGTRDNPFSWEEKAEWSDIQEEINTILRKYLEEGKFADVLKGYEAVGAGFIDGNIHILYIK